MPFPFLPVALAAGSGLMGLLNHKNKQQTTQTTRPTMDPEYAPLQTALIQRAMARMQGGSTLPTNYESSGINTINQTYDLAGQGLQNSLTSRGLGQSGAGAMARLAGGRAGEIGRFRAGVPLAQRELENQDFGMLASLLNMGRGTTAMGETTQTGGGGAAAGAENLMGMLSYLMASGAFGGGKKG